MDKDDLSTKTTMTMPTTMVRASTTQERDGNLIPPGNAAQSNGRGLPQTGTTDVGSWALNNDKAEYNNAGPVGGKEGRHR